MAGRLEITGALSPWARGLSTRLRARGYAEISIYQIARVAAELDAWMTQERVGVGGLTVDVLERFVLTRRARGAKAYITVRGLEPLIADLRAVGAVPPVILKLPSTPSELLLESYRRYLSDERALRPRSILQCLVVAGQLLARLNGRPVGSLETADVRGFIDEQGRGWGTENGATSRVDRAVVPQVLVRRRRDRPAACYRVAAEARCPRRRAA